MAPVVHGLEKTYEKRIDFLYLNIADPKTAEARRRLGFQATPQFFLLRPDGTPVEEMRGVVPADSLERAIRRLISANGQRR